MESAIYLTLTVDRNVSARNDLFICRDYHIQPSELKQLPYWEYEIIIENIQEINKKQEEEEKQRQKNGGMPEGYSMPKIPSMPQMPSINVPHF